MGLIAGGEADGARGAPGRRASCSSGRTREGTWRQEPWTGTGFPNVFYLNYQYYRHYFPLMALAQYAKARQFDPIARLRA